MKNSDEEPLVVGNYYKVSCLVQEKNGQVHKLIPIYDNYHNDVESNQKEFHYHVDFRFVGKHSYVITKQFGAIHFPYGNRLGIEGYKKETWVLKAEKEFHTATTPAFFIESTVANLRGKKLKNCKVCPHKGYNLEGVREIGGVKQCPLHGLKIDMINKEVI
jgi:hypothetical protein